MISLRFLLQIYNKSNFSQLFGAGGLGELSKDF